MNTNEGFCCYLDILGFSNFVLEDPRGAFYLLQNYQMQLTQNDDFPSHNRYLAPYLKDSFKYFIPFSDSIFIYSENPSDFVLQLSVFIHGSFSFTSHAFSSPEDPLHPENVKERSFGIIDGKASEKIHESKWYPLLFRGGIGFADANIIETTAIHNGYQTSTPVVFGNSVIEAVKFEQSGIKGPRVLCSQSFYDQLDERARKIVHPTLEENDLYEVNWTCAHYVMTDELNDWFVDKLLSDDFNTSLLGPAASLWKAYKDKPLSVSQHYLYFLKLIIKGVQHYFSGTDYVDKVESYITEAIKEKGLEGINFHY